MTNSYSDIISLLETFVTEQAPILRHQVESILETKYSQTKEITPSAPSMSAENHYYDAVSKTVAYEAAVKELRAVRKKLKSGRYFGN